MVGLSQVRGSTLRLTTNPMQVTKSQVTAPMSTGCQPDVSSCMVGSVARTGRAHNIPFAECTWDWVHKEPGHHGAAGAFPAFPLPRTPTSDQTRVPHYWRRTKRHEQAESGVSPFSGRLRGADRLNRGPRGTPSGSTTSCGSSLSRSSRSGTPRSALGRPARMIELHTRLSDIRTESVGVLRERGHSWSDIAWWLGVSRGRASKLGQPKKRTSE